MTPRQLRAWCLAAHQRHRGRQAELLAITALGSRGEPDEVKRQLREFDDELKE